MKIKSLTIWVMLAFCAAYFLGLPETIATVVYDFGGEHDIDFVINDDVRVKNNSSNVPTTVNLLPNGSVTSYMEVWDTSHVDIAGGSIFGDFYAYDDSRVSFSSGKAGQTFRVRGNSQTTITGGSIGKFQSEDYTQASISNASIGPYGMDPVGMSIQDYSQVTITNVSVGHSVETSHYSQVTIYSGSFEDDIITHGNSQLSIFGGTIGDILDVYEQSVVTIHGSNFNYGYGGITNSTGILTGMLANGDPINNRFYVHDNASILLVPEPSTLLLLGLGVPILSGLRRKR